MKDLRHRARPPRPPGAAADPADLGRDSFGRRMVAASRSGPGIAGALAVGALALVVIVGPHWLTTSPTTNEHTDPTNGVDPALLAGPCPDDPIVVTDPSRVGALPSGAEAVRLCRAAVPRDAAGADPAVSPWPAPKQALVEDVDGFLAAVSTLATRPDADCRAPVGGRGDWPYALVITYPEGDTITLAAPSRACSQLEVGGEPAPAGPVVAAFTRALAAQGGEADLAGAGQRPE